MFKTYIFLCGCQVRLCTLGPVVSHMVSRSGSLLNPSLRSLLPFVLSFSLLLFPSLSPSLFSLPMPLPPLSSPDKQADLRCIRLISAPLDVPRCCFKFQQDAKTMLDAVGGCLLQFPTVLKRGSSAFRNIQKLVEFHL